jgi:Trp operon repressor
MAKVKVYSLSLKERQRIIGDFFCLVFRLKTKDEVLHFFMGLLTSSEAVMLARRIQIATLLIDEKNSQEMIRRQLGVSFQTIQRVDQWLHSDNPKRDAWVKGEIEELAHKGRRQEMQMLTSRRGLNKYPGHRLWVELFSRLLQS